MTWPLNLEQNQNKIKCLNFKGVHPTSPLLVSLVSAFPSRSPLVPCCGNILLEVSFVGGCFWPHLKWEVPRVSRGAHLQRFPIRPCSPEREEHLKTWCQWLAFCPLIEQKGATDSSEGRMWPLVNHWPGNQFISHDLLWHPRANWCLLLGPGGLYSKDLIGTLLLNSSCANRMKNGDHLPLVIIADSYRTPTVNLVSWWAFYMQCLIQSTQWPYTFMVSTLKRSIPGLREVRKIT